MISLLCKPIRFLSAKYPPFYKCPKTIEKKEVVGNDLSKLNDGQSSYVIIRPIRVEDI
jgi:hypothetical protein